MYRDFSKVKKRPTEFGNEKQLSKKSLGELCLFNECDN